MNADVAEKILRIIDDMDQQGNVPLTRLTVLKKWFEKRGRMKMFGLWVARKAAGRKGKATGKHGALLNEARALLGKTSTLEAYLEQPDRRAAADLMRRAHDAQNDFDKQQWGPVRIIHCWPLLLVEQGLAIYTGADAHPSHGYKLAADWAQNYDIRWGNGLNGPSRGKLHELVRFIFNVESIEEWRKLPE